MEMEISLMSHINHLWVLKRHAQMNDTNDEHSTESYFLSIGFHNVSHACEALYIHNIIKHLKVTIF